MKSVTTAAGRSESATGADPTDPTRPTDPTGPGRPYDPELRAERGFLDDARAALRRMHADVVDTETPLIGGEDNDERFTNESNLRARWLRAQSLVDLPDVPLFFGRIDYDAGTVAEAGDRIHIGRRHVHDEVGTPLVIDWRARVSVPFYRATRTDRQHVHRRRRYGFSDAADLTAYDDEILDGTDTTAGEAGDPRADAFLRAVIERPRTGPMRDIVATIQPEQDDLVRAPLQPSICVQGAPGTGKTAIGLHRIAYLLYTERERLRRGGVVIVGPNRSFLSYIRKVLPALGEVDVRQTTVEELLGQTGTANAVGTAGTEDPRAEQLKGDARMAAVLLRALWTYVGTPAEGILYTKGSNRYRVHDYAVAEIVESLRGTTRYAPGRNSLAQRIAHEVLVLMERRGESPDDRVQNAVARSRPVKVLVDQVWPKVTPEQVLFRLLSDAAFLELAAGTDLTEDERIALAWRKPPRSAKSAKWSPADLVLLDELTDLIERRAGSLGHLVVDEAQDLSAMQLRALGRRCRTGSATVLGDLAQATSPATTGSWEQVFEHLEMHDTRLVELERGFRVPGEIIDFAARLLPTIAPALGRPTGFRSLPGALRVIPVTSAGRQGFLDSLADACRNALGGEGSVAMIAADADVDELRAGLLDRGLPSALLGGADDAMETDRLVCVPAMLAKGLEFDAVVVAEPAGIVAAEPRGLARLYVVLTRAVTSLHVVHAEPLPAELRGAATAG
ncbi:DNA helicase IV [Actinopolymorpha cephalotaxi]|uniref:DNA helicase IV n=1 Tax=Actinopolymorpha cephalotaxi TaxID=504797 RepID=A0A1I2YKQ1_9ACTN|nr:AAA family ATPase [Actinopolymorpha cephalotaxi]NYH86929.1 DNA helicase IV [Actinopolymorpha cephalotaxi]SFH25929.1 DNA helicase IV [Actinopolymorpha cephalotaxi]